jgi:flavin-dependent dehydrogenase
MTKPLDALVIGGGPAGSTVALLLARAGWSVALLERRTFPRRKVCGEYLSATNLPLLARLGLAGEFHDRAGPVVRRVGLFAGRTCLTAELPRPAAAPSGWGRALGREVLDSLLLRQATRAGVDVRQPWAATSLVAEGPLYRCQARPVQTSEVSQTSEVWFTARVVIAAHGSWEAGPLPSHLPRRAARPSDLLGFKAHFRNSDLPEGLMPLLAFPGGYGGMVHSDDGRVSLSCCIRRDLLAGLRRGRDPGQPAGDLVLGHIQDSCRGVRAALAGATRVGDWLAAGPIRPGIRTAREPGVFLAGNCAGEAHPVIAEGISMALQSAWLLARRLHNWRQSSGAVADLPQVGRAYARAWRGAFAARLYAAAAVAQWAMRPAAVAGTLPVLHCFPGLISWGARLSGKATTVVRGD